MPIVIAPGSGEIICDTPQRRVEILCDCEELAATWSRFGPGRDGADRHIHYHHHDLFYVIEGEFTLKIENDEHMTLRGGQLVCIPPLVIHGFANTSDTEVRFLNLHAPGVGFSDYLRALRDGKPIEDFDQWDPDGVEGIRPASEITVASLEDGTLVDVEAIAITATSVDAGAAPITRPASERGVESIYVLEGDIAFELSDREGLAAPGTWLQTPRAAASELSFPDGAPARFLTISTPATG
jgi:quercetin dioxygenase-like cupin family protein